MGCKDFPESRHGGRIAGCGPPEPRVMPRGARLGAYRTLRFAAELSSDEPDFSCETSVEEGVSADALSEEDGKAIVRALYLAPNGVQKRNRYFGRMVRLGRVLGGGIKRPRVGLPGRCVFRRV